MAIRTIVIRLVIPKLVVFRETILSSEKKIIVIYMLMISRKKFLIRS